MRFLIIFFLIIIIYFILYKNCNKNNNVLIGGSINSSYIKINLHTIDYYFLTYNNEVRRKHFLNEFSNFNITEVNPVPNIEKYKSGATGISRILDLACQRQSKNKPFKPFIIFEDDVKKYRKFPKNISIPSNTDILFIGISSFGITEEVAVNDSVIFKNIDKNIIRIYNMLSGHGFIICSIRGLLMIQKCMLEAYFTNKVWDIFTAEMQPYLNVYALKIPLVYQYGEIGGVEIPTKITYKNKIEKNLPNTWLHPNNVSIITNYTK